MLLALMAALASTEGRALYISCDVLSLHSPPRGRRQRWTGLQVALVDGWLAAGLEEGWLDGWRRGAPQPA
jgi:hypothetical protein